MVDQLERGEATRQHTDQSLISAELVTEDARLDPNQVREMLRSELLAELHNKIVRAEVLAPKGNAEEAMAPSAPPEHPSRKSSKSFSNKRRICFGVAVFLLIVGAGAGAAAALLLGERNDSEANANTAEGSDPQEGTK